MKRKKNHKNWLFLAIILAFLVKIFSFCQKRKLAENLKKFAKEEKREVKELVTGQESFKKYCRDSSNIFLDFFIPSECNGHKPKILRPKSLILVVVFLSLIKLSVTGYLLFIYPDLAKMDPAIINRMLVLTNQDRIENDLPPLALNSALTKAAQAKADDMAARGYFAHYGPDGKKPWEWINRVEYPYQFVGENLAMNFTNADSAHSALMKSESHKKNILNNRYNEVGLAMATGEINGQKTNLLVEIFATKKEIKIVALPREEQKIISAEIPFEQRLEEQPVPKEEQPAPKQETTAKQEDFAPAVLAEDTEDKKINSIETQEKKEEIEEITAIEEKGEEKEEVNNEEEVGEEEGEEELSIIMMIEGQNRPAAANISEPMNTQVLYFNSDDNKAGFAGKLITWSKYIYIAFLIFLIIALLANIVIRITIQHKSVIIHSVLVIIFISGLISIHFHFLEKAIDKIALI